LIPAVVIGSLIFLRQTASRPRATATSSASRANSKSIAVLPFENLSHDPDNAYFADGIQEEILTRLSKIAAQLWHGRKGEREKTLELDPLRGDRRFEKLANQIVPPDAK
jgi:hypothetical protein